MQKVHFGDGSAFPQQLNQLDFSPLFLVLVCEKIGEGAISATSFLMGLAKVSFKRENTKADSSALRQTKLA